MMSTTAPAMSLLRSYTQSTTMARLPWTARTCLAQPQRQQPQPQITPLPIRPFSSSQSQQKRGGKVKRDPRITIIRYHLHHPLTPRPLRFSRTRFLRHWTIHRAWQRSRAVLAREQQLSLERQYNCMRNACEALRLIDGEGLTEAERTKFGQKPLGIKGSGSGEGGAVIDEDSVRAREGRLYRMAMRKDGGVWDGVPIEYARIQTDTPAKEGWNHAWKR